MKPLLESLEDRCLLSAPPVVSTLYVGQSAVDQQAADQALLQEVVGPSDYNSSQLGALGVGPGKLDGSVAFPGLPGLMNHQLFARLMVRFEVLVGALPQPGPGSVYVVLATGTQPSYHESMQFLGRPTVDMVVVHGQPPSPTFPDPSASGTPLSFAISSEILEATLGDGKDSPLVTGEFGTFDGYVLAKTNSTTR